MQRAHDVIVNALVRTGASRPEAVVAAGASLGALTATLMDRGAEDDGSTLAARIVAAPQQVKRDAQ